MFTAADLQKEPSKVAFIPAIAADDEEETHPASGSGPATVAEAVHFANGVLDMVSVIAATLIGRGILEATAFQRDVEKYAELWREKGLPARALAAELLGERLEAIEKAKLTGKAPAAAEAPRLN
jgi:hypothetical protein